MPLCFRRKRKSRLNSAQNLRKHRKQLVTFVCVSTPAAPIDSHFGRMILTTFPIWKRSPHRGKRHAAAPASGRKSQLGLRDRGFLALLAALSHSCCEYCRLRRSALATLELATAVCIDQLP